MKIRGGINLDQKDSKDKYVKAGNFKTYFRSW